MAEPDPVSPGIVERAPPGRQSHRADRLGCEAHGDHRAAVEQIAVDPAARRHHRRRVRHRPEVAAHAGADAKVGRHRAGERRPLRHPEVCVVDLAGARKRNPQRARGDLDRDVRRPRQERLGHAQWPGEPPARDGRVVVAGGVRVLRFEHAARVEVGGAAIRADAHPPQPQRRPLRRIAGRGGRRGDDGVALHEQDERTRLGRARPSSSAAAAHQEPRTTRLARHPRRPASSGRLYHR